MAYETHQQALTFSTHHESNFSYQSSQQFPAPSAPTAITVEQQSGYSSQTSNFGPVSQAWTVPDNQIPPEPPPPYFAVGNSPRTIEQVPNTNYSNQYGSDVHASDVNHVGAPIKFKREYLVSNLAVLKVMEFVVCLIGFAACASFRDKIHLSIGTGDRSSFFVFMLVACWLFAMLVFWLNLVGYMDRYNNKANEFKMMICHVLLGFLLLLCSSLLASIRVDAVCMYIMSACTSFRIAVAGGFIATILFCADAGIQYYNYRQR